MCVAVPARVIEIHGSMAKVDMAGVQRQASLMMLPDARVGEYVILHAGFAIERLDEAEALRTLKMFKEMDDAMEAGG